jgi:predicted RNA methylase
MLAVAVSMSLLGWAVVLGGCHESGEPTPAPAPAQAAAKPSPTGKSVSAESEAATLARIQGWWDATESMDKEDRCLREVCQLPIYGLDQSIAVLRTQVWQPYDYYALSRRFRQSGIGPGLKVMDAGTGAGPLALVAVRHGASKAVGTDINPLSIENFQLNARRFGWSDRMEVRLVSLDDPGAYAVIANDERFDLILSNPPNDDVQPESIEDYSESDPGYQFVRSIIEGSPEHLTEDGRIWILYSAPGGLRFIQKVIRELGFSATIHFMEGEEDLLSHQVRGHADDYGPVTPVLEITPKR